MDEFLEVGALENGYDACARPVEVDGLLSFVKVVDECCDSLKTEKKRSFSCLLRKEKIAM